MGFWMSPIGLAGEPIRPPSTAPGQKKRKKAKVVRRKPTKKPVKKAPK